MKYNISQYASAFVAALEDKSTHERADMIRRFLSVVRKNKDWPRIGRILQEVERQSLRKQGMRKVGVESTASLSHEWRKEIEKVFGKKLVLEEKIKPELLAGVKILVDGELLIDASAKRRLDLTFV